MATKLPFDYYSDGTNAIAGTEFVHGTGTYRSRGNDSTVTTADGRIHNVRRTIEPSAEFEVYGDRGDLASATGLGRQITLKSGGEEGTTVSDAGFVGIVSAEFDANRDTTRVTIEGDPIA